jgi:hypothetical protein
MTMIGYHVNVPQRRSESGKQVLENEDLVLETLWTGHGPAPSNATATWGFAMARHIDLSSDWDRYTNKLAAVIEGMGRLLETRLQLFIFSATLDEELVLQTIILLR